MLWLITLPYHFSHSWCIYALPQQLLCSLSQLSLLPLSISLARSINTMTNLAATLRGDFLHCCALLHRHRRHDVATVQNKEMYISPLFAYTTGATVAAVFNEYHASNIWEMSQRARQLRRSLPRCGVRPDFSVEIVKWNCSSIALVTGSNLGHRSTLNLYLSAVAGKPCKAVTGWAIDSSVCNGTELTGQRS